MLVKKILLTPPTSTAGNFYYHSKFNFELPKENRNLIMGGI